MVQAKRSLLLPSLRLKVPDGVDKVLLGNSLLRQIQLSICSWNVRHPVLFADLPLQEDRYACGLAHEVQIQNPRRR
jgi:hypothetical protein